MFLFSNARNRTRAVGRGMSKDEKQVQWKGIKREGQDEHGKETV